LKTQDAVRRFQNKYRSEILTPLGLASPSGYVGAATLKKMQDIVLGTESGVVVAVTNSSTTQTQILPVVQATSSVSLGASSLATAPIPLTPTMHIAAGVN